MASAPLLEQNFSKRRIVVGEIHSFHHGMSVVWSDHLLPEVLLYYRSMWGKESEGPFSVVLVEEAQEHEVPLIHHHQKVTILGPDKQPHLFSGEWFMPA